MRIESITSYEILDSRGFPTVEVEITLNNGVCGRACVPSGASTGSHEALEKRDQNKNRYLGKGVLKVIETINTHVNEILKGIHIEDQAQIDDLLIKLDGTENKSQIGANGTLGVSLACAHTAANATHMPLFLYLGGINACTLPMPMMNIINGGAHANNGIDIQEFMIIPKGAENFYEAIQIGSEVFHQLKKILADNGMSTSVGDEGGFSPAFNTAEAALDKIMNAIELAGHTDKVKLALDVAASEFYQDDGLYHMQNDSITLNSDEMVAYFQKLCDIYPIISIEDGLAENDWSGWQQLTQTLGNKIQIVGDDIFVTNKKRLQRGINEKAANAILIKPNQIGTLSETLEVIRTAQHAGFKTIISHRSGETEDTTIADLAIATNSGQIKTGSLCRSERTAKYNQLIRLQHRYPHLMLTS